MKTQLYVHKKYNQDDYDDDDDDDDDAGAVAPAAQLNVCIETA